MGFNWRHLLLLIVAVIAVVWWSLPASREEGLQRYRSGRIAEAEPALMAEHTRDPGDRAITVALVDVLLQTGRPAAAAEVMRACVARHPEDADLSLRLVELYRQADRLDLALAHLRTLPVTPELLRRRASLAEEAGDLPQAIADLEALRTGTASDAPLLEHIALLHGWRGEVVAKVRAQELLARLTRDPTAVATWFDTARWLGDRDGVRRACVVTESLPDPGAKLLRNVVSVYRADQDLAGARRAGARLIPLAWS